MAKRTHTTTLTLALALAGAVSAATGAPPHERVLALRFHDDNALAQGPLLAPAAQRELEAATGLPLAPRGRADDGAYLFSVPASADTNAVRRALAALRTTGALVYADVATAATKQSSEPVHALLVKWNATARRDARPAMRAQLSARMGRDVPPGEARGGGVERIGLPRALTAAEADALVAQLRAHPDVAHVEADRRARVQGTPSDPLFASQWNLNDAMGGIDAPAAWSVTTGDALAPIAVLDTGILAHPDLAGRVVAGYDMVAAPVFAGDGDGRDPDPTDPGDFVTAAEAADPASPLHACATSNSTWHGTMVAGAIGAVANNGVGIAAVNWRSPLLNVRVMGKCGGALSDIADGIRWAAGLAVPGVPANPRPARVLNLSMSGQGACGPTLQSAVTEAIARGAVIVAAAGNDNVDVADRWPANCNGVIAVAATSKDGSRAFYSNFGERIALGAPGGGVGGSIQVLRNGGTTTADASAYVYGLQIGTSLAAPHVSATVSLIQAVAPGLEPAEVQALVEATARSFPAVTSDACTVASCGAGIVNAAAAVLRASGGAGAPSPPPPAPSPVPPPGPVEPPAPQPVTPDDGTTGWFGRAVGQLERLRNGGGP